MHPNKLMSLVQRWAHKNGRRPTNLRLDLPTEYALEAAFISGAFGEGPQNDVLCSGLRYWVQKSNDEKFIGMHVVFDAAKTEVLA